MRIYFDMDGTIADLYSVENWLSLLRASNVKPYVQARPLCNMQVLARLLNKLQRKGIKIGVISWASKDATPDYYAMIAEKKPKWLKTHIASVNWDFIHILPYGIPKSSVVRGREVAILFDDDKRVREEWESKRNHLAFTEKEIFRVLKAF